MDREELILTFIVIFVLIAIPSFSIYEKYNGGTLAFGIRQEELDEGVVVVYGWTTENGGWKPNEIVVRKGETIKLVIRSMDMAHGFLIPDLDVDSGVIKPGSENVIEITFDKTGEFTFYCGVYCSPLHYKMTGRIVVVG
jgi:cytochrome c oxidase subunit 2